MLRRVFITGFLLFFSVTPVLAQTTLQDQIRDLQETVRLQIDEISRSYDRSIDDTKHNKDDYNHYFERREEDLSRTISDLQRSEADSEDVDTYRANKTDVATQRKLWNAYHDELIRYYENDRDRRIAEERLRSIMQEMQLRGLN